jgi:hypothetical protein
MKTPHRIAIVVALVTVVATACSGDDGADPTSTVADGATTTTTATQSGGGDDTTTTQASTGGGEASDDGTSSATVTIGDTTWTFATTGFPAETCDPNFFGGFFAVLYMADDNGELLLVDGQSSGIGITLPGENWASQGIDDPASVEVTIAETDESWVANPDTNLPGIEAGQSQVDDWTIDGNTASGTATFVEENAAYAAAGGTGDPVQPMTGTFEVTCAG